MLNGYVKDMCGRKYAELIMIDEARTNRTFFGTDRSLSGILDLMVMMVVLLVLMAQYEVACLFVLFPS